MVSSIACSSRRDASCIGPPSVVRLLPAFVRSSIPEDVVRVRIGHGFKFLNIGPNAHIRKIFLVCISGPAALHFSHGTDTSMTNHVPIAVLWEYSQDSSVLVLESE